MYEVQSDGPRRLRLQRYLSKDFSGLEEVISDFLSGEKRKISSACFGIAGPVFNNRCSTTNLPWVVDAEKVGKTFGIHRVSLINDLEAFAYGLSGLKPSDVLQIQYSKASSVGNAALLAAGTGLGEGILYFDGEKYRPFATEGGHTDFGPRNALQRDLLVWLEKQYGHVSWERLVSGPGILTLYRFLREYRGIPEPEWLREEFSTGTASPVIFSAGMANRCSVCRETLELFLEFYASEAANLAMKSKALGGVFLGGSITRSLKEWIHTEKFREAFLDKGRMRTLLENIPVYLILKEGCPVDGAAWYAAYGALAFQLSVS
jgi:glucokinase